MTRVSLSKVFMWQKKVWAMLKKSMPKEHERKKKSMPKSMNNPMLKSMKKRKKERKIAHTFK